MEEIQKNVGGPVSRAKKGVKKKRSKKKLYKREEEKVVTQSSDNLRGESAQQDQDRSRRGKKEKKTFSLGQRYTLARRL